MKPVTITILVLLVLLGTVVGLFGYQNLRTQVDLVLSLGPAGSWFLGRALPVPYLMGGAFLAGLAVGVVWLGGKAGVASRRASSLERQVAALQDEVAWGRRDAAGSPVTRGASARVAAPAAGRPVPVASASAGPSASTSAGTNNSASAGTGAPASTPAAPKPNPVAAAPAPRPVAAVDPPDFDDLI